MSIFLRGRSSALLALCVGSILAIGATAALAAPPMPVVGHPKIASGGLAGGVLGSGDKFGYAVAQIGDLDGDGVPDLAVGAPGTLGVLGTDTNTGAVWVLLMHADGTVKSAAKTGATSTAMTGRLQQDDQFGASVYGVGDLNGDGIPDIAVGAPNDDDKDTDNNGGDDGNGVNRGAIYILHLATTGAAFSDVQKFSDLDLNLDLPNDSEQFGSGVVFLGDLDGPGGTDFALAVGAKGDRDADGGSGFLRGAVDILFMNNNILGPKSAARGRAVPAILPPLTLDHVQKISDTQGTPAALQLHNSDTFGRSVGRLADLDGDGRPELLVGAPLDDDNNDGDATISANHGAVYVMFLDADGTVRAFQKISETAGGFGGSLDASDFFGDGVAGLGDLDLDGVPELLVGASGDDDGASGAGGLWLAYLDYSGGNVSVKAQAKISDTVGGFHGPLDPDDAFGTAVAAIGDLDGDGAQDAAAGAPGDDDGAGGAGASYVLNLNEATATAIDVSPLQTLCGEKVSLTATVTTGTIAGPFGVTPGQVTGPVQFNDGASPLGSPIPVTDGTAVLSITTLTVGKHDLSATFTGDIGHTPSVSTSVSQVVSPHPSATVLVVAPDTTRCGDKVTLTATVAPQQGGTVQFQDGGNPLGAPISLDPDGVAVLSLTDLAVGTHSLTASYSGDACNQPSESNKVAHEVVRQPVTVTLVSDTNPAKAGTKIIFTATVSPAAATGSVILTEGSTVLDTQPLASGVATFSIDDLPVGTHAIVAQYVGDGCYAPGGASVDQLIVPDQAPTVHVDYPNEPDVILYVGGTAKLRWTATDDNEVTSVDLYVSRNGKAGSYESIATGEPNDGTYTWQVNGPGTNLHGTPIFTAYFKVVAHDAANNTGEDNTDEANPFAIHDQATEVLLSLFRAAPVTEGVELRWRFGQSYEPISVSVERADAASGPWAAVRTEQHDEDGVTVAIDRGAAMGSTYFYRLLAATGGGEVHVFGPLSGTAGVSIKAFALAPVSPSPGSGPFRVEFAVPHSSVVLLSVVDIQGREVARLAQGEHAPGRYQVTWSGQTDRGAAPVGIYFIRLGTPRDVLTRRLVLTR